jgi:hypothetical protein
MRLHCEFSTPVALTDLDDYIRHLEIGVGSYDEDGLNEYIGSLKLYGLWKGVVGGADKPFMTKLCGT